MITLTVQSTHVYLAGCEQGWLLVDAGWAGTLPRLETGLKRCGVAPQEIRFVLATHYHPDHGGLVQEVKRAFGARLILHERQIPGLAELRAFYARKPGKAYLPVEIEPGDVLLRSALDDNHAALLALGIHGAVVETPGHSDDSVCVVLGGGEAFTGDLHLPGLSLPGTLEATCESWRRLLRRGACVFYPAHAEPFPMEMLSEQLRDCV